MSDPSDDLLPTLADEFAARLRRGEAATVAEYADAHPALADAIWDLFPSVQMMEQLALQREQERLTKKASPAAAAPDLERLGDYRIVRRIGQGGMGIVYEAVHESLGRRVAVKVLLPPLATVPQQVARFVREAQAAARLHHTNIVPVFGVGADRGHHYYVMQLIDGTGLDRAVGPCAAEATRRRSPPAAPADAAALPSRRQAEEAAPREEPAQTPFQDVARIGVQAAEALAYAHGQGTLHRDIKPANLLLDASGVVWVADFGLAKVVEDATQSHSGHVVGTLRYMAPEQINGHAEPRSDIYSLGLTLFELLAGRPAFDATLPSSLIKKIMQGELLRLRHIQPNVPRDLETIVAKATARDAAERYDSAAALADDLRRFLEDRPIRARRVTLAEQAWRWARRKPALAGLSASALLLLVAVTLLSSIGYVQIRRARDAVHHALDEARDAEAQARDAEAQARDAAHQAEQERRRTQREFERADANLTVALAALDEISDKLASRRLPQSIRLGPDEAPAWQTLGGLSAEDAEIVQSLLKFYDQFAARNAAESGVDFATARGHRRIGDIRARLGQYDEAVAAFGRALDLAEELRPAQPTNRALVLFEVQTRNAQGAALLKSGDFKRAIESHGAALQRLASSNHAATEPRELRYERALTLDALVLARSAAFMEEQKRRGPRRPNPDSRITAPPEIERDRQQAIRLFDGLLKEDPQNADYLQALARCHRGMLPVAWANEDQAAATAAKQRAIAILQQLAARRPDDLTIQFELADTLAMTAQADARTPLPESDVAVLEQSLQLAEGLHEKCPLASEYALLLATVHQRLGTHFTAVRAWPDAQAHLTTAATELESLVKAAPTNPLFHISLARVRWELADSLQRQGSYPPARELLEKAIAQYAAFRDTEAGRRASVGLLVGLYREWARVLEQLGEKQLAAEASRTADRLRDSSR